ncbi:glycosyltransferase [Methylomonas albis]|uniref:Glycosyltransferase family 4 protein n=1 Tax=Methylomonas albis TaxID=1854563 RepID=A0ABR9CYJ4_9GAMM|nr:glycosyltransferase [Methylomonas albis]MBD9355765.1 glycosyltransferase family 4 protein [Methylomonas albis]
MPSRRNNSFGINLIGYVSSNVSLGITARHFIKLFLNKGIPVSVFDIDYKRAPNARAGEYDALAVTSAADLPYSINLFFLSMGQLPDFFLNPPAGLFDSAKLNAGLIWCEETVLPKRYCEALRLFDVVLAGSHFVRHVFDTNLSDVLTLDCIHPLFLPSGIVANRSYFGLPSDRLLFVSSFDPHHDPARKNPFGAVDAFLTAFPAPTDSDDLPHLVVKLNNAEIRSNDCDPMALVEQLKARCAGNPRVHFIAKSLSYSDVLSLYDSCDVFVSMHRAEGLGLGPLECMALGKPVIATAWSGNMSFMKHTNSCLVGYDLVPYTGMAAKGPDQLGRKARWAEPHIDEAADWMKQLAIDSDLRTRIGSQAMLDAKAYHQSSERLDFIDEFKALLAEKSFLTRRSCTKTADLTELRQARRAFNYFGWAGAKRRVDDLLNRHVYWRFNKN